MLPCRAVEIDVACPSCGEPLTVWVDVTGGSRQRYVEDCAVCCRPMEVLIALDADGDPSVSVRTLDA
jgi:Cysteine-rich CPXCG